MPHPLNGKPEAYRYVLRHSRKLYENLDPKKAMAPPQPADTFVRSEPLLWSDVLRVLPDPFLSTKAARIVFEAMCWSTSTEIISPRHMFLWPEK